jgi:hypothetical protein
VRSPVARAAQIIVAVALLAGCAPAPVIVDASPSVPTGPSAAPAVPPSAAATPPPSLGPTATATGSLVLIGHDPLHGRGMNAALAIAGRYAYVGSRTDGASQHRHPGIQVVDIGNPVKPRVVHEIGPPGAGNRGETARELRVWPRQGLLIVLSFDCDPAGHDCDNFAAAPALRFFDIRGGHTSAPTLIRTFYPSLAPHEFFLWQDPQNADRALLYLSTPGSSREDLLVVDISRVRSQAPVEMATWRAPMVRDGPNDELHSVSVSPDGRRAYLAFLTAGFLVADVASLAENAPHPAIAAVTPPEGRLRWQPVGPHSAVKLPGRPIVLTTDEVYGGIGADAGCPWGWARLIDVSDDTAPKLASEYRVQPYNDQAACPAIPEERKLHGSLSSHNPTVSGHIALVSWHAAGLQVFDTTDPSKPASLAAFVPDPLPTVGTEDPLLSSGPDKVVMWSYPIVRDGLIYVVDVRNGLFILRYQGPNEQELSAVRFLEGNSNLGDGARP